MKWTLIRIIMAALVAWVTGPLFFGLAGASANPAISLAIRGGIFLGVYLVLSFIVRKK